MPEITDEFILSLFSNEKTKEKAFELLLKKYQKHIYYSARRIVTIHEDADDVTQNVCIKIWKNLDKFRSESSLKTWISRICINEALTYIDYAGIEKIIANESDYKSIVGKWAISMCKGEVSIEDGISAMHDELVTMGICEK